MLSMKDVEQYLNCRNGRWNYLRRIPTGRWGQPRDIGGGAVFLASAAANYMTGITLPIDGGWLSR